MSPQDLVLQAVATKQEKGDEQQKYHRHLLVLFSSPSSSSSSSSSYNRVALWESSQNTSEVKAFVSSDLKSDDSVNLEFIF
jgi:hypothetical protein